MLLSNYINEERPFVKAKLNLKQNKKATTAA